MEIRIKNSNNLKMPYYATEGSAGFDLTSSEDVTILPGQVVAINTGIVGKLPKGYLVQICDRNGLALKQNIFILNSPGIWNEDYHQEIKIILCNASSRNFSIGIGDRIAQGILLKYEKAEFIKVDEI